MTNTAAAQTATANAAQTPMGQGAEVATAAPQSANRPCACGGVTFRSFGKDETRKCLATTKRTFAPGHDAKLKGELIRRELVGDVVVLASGEVVSPTAYASRFGFADMVAAGVRNHLDREQAKAAKKEATAKARIAKTVERKLAKKAGATAPKTVSAKVGRWVYEGTLNDKGTKFTYLDKKGATQETKKFTLV
jgi:hypothetical protein